ncbi:MAG: outer membrane protein assembly factor BamD [Bacteroidales bacterium]|nr:outer membrane protein assembly factor BamD [Bacteroidales bacterium]
MRSKSLAILLAATLAATALVPSCKSQYEALLDGNDVDAKYAAAFEYFNAGKYQKAAALFESLAVLTSGSERDDTVQYYWGLSNYRYQDYYTAETNFTRFLENFPRSPFAESARFFRLDCLYKSTYRYELDQVPTYNAITAISEFIVEYPDNPHIPVCNRMLLDLNERLDRKAYENARIYYKMEDYKAARVALKNVLKDDADNIYREEILYYTAMSSYKYAFLSVPSKQKERYLYFVDDYYNFVGEFPESKHRKELDALYRKVKNNETSAGASFVQ